MFISAYKSSDLVRLRDITEVYYVLGVIDQVVLKPARCPICGEFVYMDANLGLYQCSHCNNKGTLYQSRTLNLRVDWEVYDGSN